MSYAQFFAQVYWQVLHTQNFRWEIWQRFYQHYHFRYGITVTQWVRFIKKGFDFDHTHPWGWRGCCQHIYSLMAFFSFHLSVISQVSKCVERDTNGVVQFRIVFSAIFHAQKITLFCLLHICQEGRVFSCPLAPHFLIRICFSHLYCWCSILVIVSIQDDLIHEFDIRSISPFTLWHNKRGLTK